MTDLPATGYPVILCGDHAEFETEHANTPPHERPDWPLPSFDARDWAQAFCKIAAKLGTPMDDGWMMTWFANALMRGYDEHAKRASDVVERLTRERDEARGAALEEAAQVADKWTSELQRNYGKGGPASEIRALKSKDPT